MKGLIRFVAAINPTVRVRYVVPYQGFFSECCETIDFIHLIKVRLHSYFVLLSVLFAKLIYVLGDEMGRCCELVVFANAYFVGSIFQEFYNLCWDLQSILWAFCREYNCEIGSCQLPIRIIIRMGFWYESVSCEGLAGCRYEF